MSKGDTESPSIIFHKYMWIYNYLKTEVLKITEHIIHWKYKENKYLWAPFFKDSIILEEVEYGTPRGNI